MKRAVWFGVACLLISGVTGVVACVTERARPIVDAAAPNNVIDCDAGGPGGFPPAMCDPSDNTCPPVMPACMVDKATCGDPTTCLPLADNTKKTTLDFRMRRLLITAPEALTAGTIGLGVLQTTVIDKGIDLDAVKCGDHGNGAFSWLMRVDQVGNTLKTGGAPPSTDPQNIGYCFYNFNIGGIDVTPIQSPITFDDAGAFSTAAISLLNVPIFLTADGGAADPGNVVILPLRNASIQQATISAGGDCIGTFDQNSLEVTDQNGTCLVADPSSCSKWRTAGALGGAITLEDADKVPLTILPETLCVLLTQTPAVNQKCARDGSNNIMAKGDYCSTSKQPGDCQDSFWLSATFAAAAITINDGSSEPTCQGGGNDGGTNDATTDAPSDAAGE